MVIPIVPLLAVLLSSAVWGFYFQDMRVFFVALTTFAALYALLLAAAALAVHHLWYHMSGHDDEDY